MVSEIKISGSTIDFKLEMTNLFWSEIKQLKRDGLQNSNFSVEGADGSMKMQIEGISWKDAQEIVDGFHTLRNEVTNQIVDKEKAIKIKETLEYGFIGQKLNAVKMFKDQTNSGLKESKDAVEYLLSLCRVGNGPGEKYLTHTEFEIEWPVVRQKFLANLMIMPQLSKDYIYPMFTPKEVFGLRGEKLVNDLGL